MSASEVMQPEDRIRIDLETGMTVATVEVMAAARTVGGRMVGSESESKSEDGVGLSSSR